MVNKIQRITTGFVIQTYEEGKCTGQEFVAGGDTWEDECGETVAAPQKFEEVPLEMVQPCLRPDLHLVVQIIDDAEVVQIEKANTQQEAIDLAMCLAKEYYNDAEVHPKWGTIEAEIRTVLNSSGHYRENGLYLAIQPFKEI
jgi:hypothetical protein